MADNKSTNASKAIMTKIGDLETRMDELAVNIKVTTTEIMGKLDQLIVRANQPAAAKSRGTSTKSNAASTATVPEKKKPGNSLAWFKENWKKERAATVKKYCLPEMMNELNKFMTTDPAAKNKSGVAKEDAEINFIWNTYVRPKECGELRNKIKIAYDAYLEAWEKENMTPVNKDSDGKPGSKAKEVEIEDASDE